MESRKNRWTYCTDNLWHVGWSDDRRSGNDRSYWQHHTWDDVTREPPCWQPLTEAAPRTHFTTLRVAFPPSQGKTIFNSAAVACVWLADGTQLLGNNLSVAIVSFSPQQSVKALAWSASGDAHAVDCTSSSVAFLQRFPCERIRGRCWLPPIGECVCVRRRLPLCMSAVTVGNRSTSFLSLSLSEKKHSQTV